LFRFFLHSLIHPATHRLFTNAAFLVAAAFFLAGCAGYVSTTPATLAALSVSATSFNFKTVVLGQTVTQTLHLSNSGTAPLRITSLALPDKEFVISGPSVPRVVLPSMGLDYTLSFTPSAAGSATAALTIGSNAATSVTSVSLSGVGEKVIATVNVSPSSISFGNMVLHTTSSKNVTLQNTGDINITISGVTVVGSGFGYSDLSPGFSLAPNQSVTFQVWFRPTVKGAASGTVSVLSANLASPAEMALAGDGVSPTSNPPPSSPAPPPAPVQHTVHLTWNSNDTNIAGYHVYRSKSSDSGFSQVTSALLPSTNYDDSTVDSGTTYYYAVTVVTFAGDESGYSHQATAVVPTP
jgi:hypothetical protein